MIDTLRLLMSSQLKRSKLNQKSGGFTLIELVVAMVLAGLVITPLFGFMHNIMDTERKEQAKATSDQEIQSALDYIAQDLKQAVYIYDAEGLNNISTNTPPGIKNQIPPVAAASGCQNTISTTCVPVLVFWKRELRQNVLPSGDAFVYSLVGYYLIKGNNGSETWSNAARIGRFQIRDGVRNPTTPTSYITGEIPSPGFQLFDLTVTGITLKDKMNRWLKKANENYTVNALTLVDFIDQSTDGITANCPATTQQVPSTLAGGFYACVDSSRTWAQIYIRGNALARIENNSTYSANKSSYFPTVSIQVQGRGLLGFD